MRDGTETDVDCGGGSCPKCVNGKACLQDYDCQSGNCNFVDGGMYCGN